MCTAVGLRDGAAYFGRTLDLEEHFGERITLQQRYTPIEWRHAPAPEGATALYGCASVVNGRALFAEGANEAGLAMAGLNFPSSACWRPTEKGKLNLASFEVISWLLAQCRTVAEVKNCAAELNITDESFLPGLPAAPLHFMAYDGTDCLVLEQTACGLQIYDNPTGVMTNNPPLEEQLHHYGAFAHLSPANPANRSYRVTAQGFGGMGLPGDLTPASRFVRAAWARAHSRSLSEREEEKIAHFFHLLEFVSMPRGVVLTDEGKVDQTLYRSCFNLDEKRYYIQTYEQLRPTCLDLNGMDLDGDRVRTWPLPQGGDFARVE